MAYPGGGHGFGDRDCPTLFDALLEAWQAQDVYIFCLPIYSPHLNKIETLWRKIKYEWLRPEDYADCKTLKTAVWHILDRVGQQYTIQYMTKINLA